MTQRLYCIARIFNLLLAAVFLGMAPAATAQFLSGGNVTAELISLNNSVQPGSTAQLALKLKHAPKWHTYWVNPGDSGIVTQIQLDLPDSFKVSEFNWPAPKLYDSSGIINYVFEDEVLLMFELSIPANVEAGTSLNITGEANWLECDDEMCVPGSSKLSLSLPVSTESPQPGTTAADFQKQTDLLPQQPPANIEFKAYRDGDKRFLAITPQDSSISLDPAALYFYSRDGHIVTQKSQSIQPYGENGVLFEFALEELFEGDPASLTGVVENTNLWSLNSGKTSKAIAVDIDYVDGAPPVASGSLGGTTVESQPVPNLLPLLGLAFLGGLILNLMPCVFPVLGLKILGFVNQAGSEKKKVVLHGLVFTTGVLTSFWVLAGVLIVLREGGQEIGWGFQLQSTGFVLGLSILMLVFALSLSGVFEFGLSAVGAGSQLTAKSGFSGTYFSGVLATVVATPCAAPFLAPALGAALSLPPLPSLVVFTFIGLGLSAPYMLLSAFPALINFLPKPGAWMETFKQLMAFPLYATVGYLVWNLAGLVNEEQFLNILFALVLIAMACWIYGRYFTLSAPTKTKLISGACVLLVAAGGIALAFHTPKKLEWETWSPERVASLIANKQPFYIDFTARWCATCQVNKRVVFSSEEVLSEFKKNDVVLLKADWTNQDATITQALAKYGRSAVPFNLIYGSKVDKPQILPEALTPGIVLDALEQVN